jgi:hypothetical protein
MGGEKFRYGNEVHHVAKRQRAGSRPRCVAFLGLVEQGIGRIGVGLFVCDDDLSVKIAPPQARMPARYGPVQLQKFATDAPGEALLAPGQYIDPTHRTPQVPFHRFSRQVPPEPLFYSRALFCDGCEYAKRRCGIAGQRMVYFTTRSARTAMSS